MTKTLGVCTFVFSSICGASLYQHNDMKNPATKLVVFMTGSTLLVSVLTLFKKIK